MLQDSCSKTESLARSWRIILSTTALVLSSASTLASQTRDLRPEYPTIPDLPSDWSLGEDPFINGSGIGELHLPAGRLKRIDWYEAGESGGHNGDPPGWEKRVVFSFDAQGRCIEEEGWIAGVRVTRRVLSPARIDQGDRVFSWSPREDTMREAIRDEKGRMLATLAYEWIGDEFQSVETEPKSVATFEYDALGRILRTSHPESRWTQEFWRDPAGTVRIARSSYSPGGDVVMEFDHDRLGQIVLARIAGKDFENETEYTYDERGILTRTCTSPEGRGLLTSHYEYDPEGRLVKSQTIQTKLLYPRDWTVITEVVFDGVDRPLLRTVRDSDGRCTAKTTWSYANDSRGNWILKTPRDEVGEFDGYSTWRVIEYAD